MSLIRIEKVEALTNWGLRLTLTNGEIIDREISPFLHGPMFDPIRASETLFRAVRAEGGTVVWPNGADLCPDVLIWGGMPDENSMHVPDFRV